MIHVEWTVNESLIIRIYTSWDSFRYSNVQSFNFFIALKLFQFSDFCSSDGTLTQKARILHVQITPINCMEGGSFSSKQLGFTHQKFCNATTVDQGLRNQCLSFKKNILFQIYFFVRVYFIFGFYGCRNLF